MTVPEQVANPLTLIMTTKSPDASKELRALVTGMQSLPAEKNPIAVALTKISTVHFARFVFLDDRHLAVITTYDGEFDRYIDAFINEIGHVFDALLSHIEDAPPLPVSAHRDEFLAYVKKNDVPCIPPFYCAYPKLKVLDILTLDRGQADS